MRLIAPGTMPDISSRPYGSIKHTKRFRKVRNPHLRIRHQWRPNRLAREARCWRRNRIIWSFWRAWVRSCGGICSGYGL